MSSRFHHASASSLEDSDALARAVLDRYRRLPARGKPQSTEWTVLAGIVARTESEDIVVSLATGNRCLGVCQLCDKGTVVNDSHAEVLARRSFKKFCLHEMLRIARGEGMASPFFNFCKRSRVFSLKPSVTFHLYVSAPPCGDASVFPRGGSDRLILTGAKEIDAACTSGKSRGELTGSLKPPKPPCANKYSATIGVLRTKSGRSDLPDDLVTRSMSCSDKIACWHALGLQGSLIAPFFPPGCCPLPLSSVVVSRQDTGDG